MNLTPDFSRVASYTPEQWQKLLKENPDAVGPYLDSLEESGDPNLDTHRYFLNLRAEMGGDQSETIGDGAFVVSMVFDFDHVLLEDLDEGSGHYKRATLRLQNGQIVFEDDVTGGPDAYGQPSKPISEYSAFQGVTPETLPTALNNWYVGTLDHHEEEWEHDSGLIS